MKIIKLINKSMKIQMILLFCILISVVCTSMGFMSYYLSSNALENKTNELLRNNIILTLLFLVLGVFVISTISNNITNSIRAMAKEISILANGELTHTVAEKYRKKQNEIGVLANSLITMQNAMRDRLSNIKDSFLTIDTQSENLSEISKHVSIASESITTSIQDVAKGTGIQAAGHVRIIAFLNQFALEMEKITQAINGIDKNARNINVMAEDSSNNIQILEKSSRVIDQSFIDLIDEIIGFGKSIKQINEMTDFIKNIADQTNLLSINASIEAARAGESGRTFAVVADQIKKLADQTKVSSEKIDTIVNGIYAQTEDMVSNTNTFNAERERQISVLQTCMESFERIINAIKIIIPEITSVNQAALRLNNNKNEIIEKIEGEASVSQEVSASSEEIAAASREMNASMQEIAVSAQLLSNKTKIMKDKINQFKI